MEEELMLAYRALNALSQHEPVSDAEIEVALAAVNSAIHQVHSLRHSWERMGRELRLPVLANMPCALPAGPQHSLQPRV
jgi:hypothetical protein